MWHPDIQGTVLKYYFADSTYTHRNDPRLLVYTSHYLSFFLWYFLPSGVDAVR